MRVCEPEGESGTMLQRNFFRLVRLSERSALRVSAFLSPHPQGERAPPTRAAELKVSPTV